MACAAACLEALGKGLLAAEAMDLMVWLLAVIGWSSPAL